MGTHKIATRNPHMRHSGRNGKILNSFLSDRSTANRTPADHAPADRTHPWHIQPLWNTHPGGSKPSAGIAPPPPSAGNIWWNFCMMWPTVEDLPVDGFASARGLRESGAIYATYRTPGQNGKLENDSCSLVCVVVQNWIVSL